MDVIPKSQLASAEPRHTYDWALTDVGFVEKK